MSLEPKDAATHASKPTNTPVSVDETISRVLKRILPARSHAEVAAKNRAMSAAWEQARLGDGSAGDENVLCFFTSLIARRHVHAAALGLLGNLWEMGLIEELPRTEADLLGQITLIKERLLTQPAELPQKAGRTRKEAEHAR